MKIQDGILTMVDTISLDNLDVKELFQVMEAMNLDKLLGITFDEYMFIASLPKNMNEDEIMVQLLMYRQNKKLHNNDKEGKGK